MARSGWNSHFPSVAGLEYVGTGTRSYLIQQATDERVIRFFAQTTGPLNEVQLYLGPNTSIPLLSSAWALRALPFVVDLLTKTQYDAQSLDVGGSAAPGVNGLTNVTQVQNEDGSAATDFRLQAPNDGFYLKRIATAGDHHCDVGWSQVILTGNHIRNISLTSQMNQAAPLIQRRGDNNVAGAAITYQRQIVAGDDQWNLGELWVETGLTGWQEVSPADWLQFNAVAGNRRWRLQYTGSSSFQWDYLDMRASYVTERRAGTGVLDVTGVPQQNAWVSVPLHVPAATGAPSLVAGTEYVLRIRPAYQQNAYGKTGIVDLRAIADRTGVHFTDLDWDGYSTTPSGSGEGSVLVLPPLDGLIATRCATGPTAPTNDSQPYEFTVGAQVGSGRDARQIALPVSTGVQYGIVKAVLSASREPTANLSVTVRNSATQAVIAGPIAVTLAQLDAAALVGTDDFGDEYREVYVDLVSSFTLPSTVDLQFASTTPTGAPWLVAGAANRFSTATNVTFGGASSYATGAATSPVDGTLTTLAPPVTGTSFSGDLEVVVMVRPPPVTGSPLTIGTQVLTGGTCVICPQDASCAVTGIPLPTVAWTSSPVTGFGFYEIQRKDGTEDFVTVAKQAPASANSYVDYAAPFGIDIRYRIRVVQSSGAQSLWSNEVTGHINPPAAANIIITAPTDPTLNVAYPSVHGDRLPAQSDWSITDASDTVLMPLYGKDGQLALRPTERRGIQFTRTLLLSAFCTTPQCLAPSDALRELMTGGAPYLVVRDDRGCAWFMSVSISGVTRLADPDVGDIWSAAVTFTETPTPEVVVATT